MSVPRHRNEQADSGAINAGKIARIETFHLSIPAQYGGPKPRETGQWPFIEMLAVRIETDTGLVGWGEAFGHKACTTTKSALETLIIPQCIGLNAGDIDGLNTKLHKALHVYGIDGIISFALSGIDIAMWDIRGQALGLPIYKLLGGTSKKVSAYASLLRYGDADMVGQAAADAVARGHAQVKLHEASVEAVIAARSAVGPDIGLMLDVNCRWSHEQALQMADDLAPASLMWIEEPCWPPRAETYRLMALQSGAKIAAGENAASIDELAVLCMSGAIVYVQPSAAKFGGISGLLTVRDIAKINGVNIATHSAYFGPGLAATIQFCAGTEQSACEWYDCKLETNPFGIAPQNGAFHLNTAPGLGLKVDETALRHYQIR